MTGFLDILICSNYLPVLKTLLKSYVNLDRVFWLGPSAELGQEFELKNIPIRQIFVSKLNARTVNLEMGVEELAASIRKIGLQQPVVVVKENSKYELIIGQRRFLAAKRAGLSEIPAIIRHLGSEREKLVASFSENIHRLDLDYKDKSKVAETLLSHLGTTKAVANQLGVSEQTVRNYLGYSIVSNGIKDMVDKHESSATTAIRIARSIPDEEKAFEIAKKVKEMPRSKDRKGLINLARENPSAKPAELVKMTESLRFTRITIDLTPRVAEALALASTEFKTDKKDIAAEALATWLEQRGFL